LGSIGFKLRSIRQQRQLSLREVEERSVRAAQERRDPAYQISASWLNRLEREAHEPEFQRPIYFLRAQDGYVCARCELDKDSKWLTLIPHPMSAASIRRWRYQTEIESVGRVVAMAVRLPE
jgi:transcriptional regulator with XRE-family HTH domain